eukprot:TRINITY_DN74746_c0_g1_i1.p1 TRINITY_DN74746_c0_g1~~TRINITY_DN74746_c0_g1_i1.p1  ORF type:complete len:203 (+),score=23.62 TRINITY_DN74746_c0_g1_i1:51-659(+)
MFTRPNSASWQTPRGTKSKTIPGSQLLAGSKSFSLPGSKSKSLPTLPGQGISNSSSSHRKGVFPPNTVPAPLDSFDYWKALQCFDMFDVHKSGYLDRQLFYKMLCSLCVGCGLSRRKINIIFDSIDFTGCGKITCEEFLGWIFGTYSCFSQRVRHSLTSINDHEFVRQYRGLRKNVTGDITQAELWHLVSLWCPEKLTDEES